ncbi:MAG TPA: hypothetical protein VF510_16535 [Ktedonobacterales bacterium]
MPQDETRHDHPITRRTSHRLSLLVPLTALTLVAVLTGIFLTRSLAAPRPSSHSTAVTHASPTLQCGIAIDYTSVTPVTFAELKHESDIVVLGVVTGSANSFNDWYVSIVTVVYDRRQILTNTQTIIVRQDHAMIDGCFNADDPLLTVGERTFLFLSGGISFSGTTPYYHEIFDANCRFPSVNGLVPRNITHSITFDKPPTEASFIAQVRAANP